MKNTGLNGYVYDFGVDYDAAVDILNVRKYLMKKMGQYNIIRFVRQIFVSAMMFLVVIYQIQIH